MKIPSIFYIALLVIMPFLSGGTFYWLTNEIEQIYADYPNVETINVVNSCVEIDKLKKLLIESFSAERKARTDTIETYHAFVQLLFTFAICNIVFLFMLYRNLSNKVSNKSLKNGTPQ